MSVVLKLLRWLALTVLGFLFFFAFSAFVTATVVRNDLIKASFYKGILNDANVYERLYTEILPQVASSQSFTGGLQIPQEDSIAILRQVFPMEFLQQSTERDLDNAEAYMKKKSDDLDLRVDLRPAKARVTPVVVEYLNKRLDAAPVCTPQQNYDMNRFQADLSRGSIPPCIPQGIDLNQVKAQAGSALTPYIQQAIAKAPDAWDPVEQMAKSDGQTRAEFLTKFDTARGYVSFVNGAGYNLLVVALILIIVLSLLLRMGDRKGMLRGVGGMIFGAALPVLIFAIIFGFIVPSKVSSSISDSNSTASFSTAAIHLTADVARLALKGVGRTLLLTALFMVIAGGILFIGSFFVDPRKKSAPQSRGTGARSA